MGIEGGQGGFILLAPFRKQMTRPFFPSCDRPDAGSVNAVMAST